MDMISTPSAFGAAETLEHLEAAVRARGMTVFARVDHGAGAKEVGLPLRPTVVVLFGNARGGTPLMEMDARVGLDLPLKALVWEDEGGKTWVSYEDPTQLVAKYGLPDAAMPVAQKIAGALRAVVQASTAR